MVRKVLLQSRREWLDLGGQESWYTDKEMQSRQQNEFELLEL